MRRLSAGAAMCFVVAGALGLAGCWREDPEPYGAPSSAQAEDPFAAGVNRDPTPGTMYSMARILASQGRDQECAILLGRTIRKYPKFVPAYCELAELHLRNGRLQQAMGALLAGLEVDPNDARLINNLGMCFTLRQDPQAALRLFTRAAALRPNDGRYRTNMAMLLGMSRRYDEALALYQQVVSDADAHHNVAVLAEHAGDVQRARQEYLRAKALAPATRPALPRRGAATRPSPPAAQPASQPGEAPPGQHG